eukprot:473382-Rhodomonas_salina.1
MHTGVPLFSPLCQGTVRLNPTLNPKRTDSGSVLTVDPYARSVAQFWRVVPRTAVRSWEAQWSCGARDVVSLGVNGANGQVFGGEGGRLAGHAAHTAVS